MCARTTPGRLTWKRCCAMRTRATRRSSRTGEGRGLGWAGLGWARLGRLGWAVLGQAGPAGLGWGPLYRVCIWVGEWVTWRLHGVAVLPCWVGSLVHSAAQPFVRWPGAHCALPASLRLLSAPRALRPRPRLQRRAGQVAVCGAEPDAGGGRPAGKPQDPCLLPPSLCAPYAAHAVIQCAGEIMCIPPAHRLCPLRHPRQPLRVGDRRRVLQRAQESPLCHSAPASRPCPRPRPCYPLPAGRCGAAAELCAAHARAQGGGLPPSGPDAGVGAVVLWYWVLGAASVPPAPVSGFSLHLLAVMSWRP